ncbi:50S ribosomal protein L32e, partial [Candidatus Woesearchaeota archaeon]|nr:50S ribosomal protein L32e [Candidatus Woesearchaeota archaeon]
MAKRSDDITIARTGKMTDTKQLNELKRQLKKKKPNFLRQDYHKKKRLANKWRKPKGLQSKLRLQKAGHRKKVSSGFGSPASVRFLHSSGLLPVMVYTPADLESIDSEKQGIIISKVTGKKKKIAIIKKAQEKNISILSIKDPIKYVEDIEKKIEEKKSAKQAEKKKREDKAKQREKKAKEEKDKEEKKEIKKT